MRPPPLPFPPGLGKLAKQARANGGAALEVLADAWEMLGGEMSLEIAAELRARDWAFISQRERPRWALRRVIGRRPLTPDGLAEILRQTFQADRLYEAFYRRAPFFNVVRRDDPQRLAGIRFEADPNVPPGEAYLVRAPVTLPAGIIAPGYNLRVKL